MNLRSVATDCLLLSWALPAQRLPPLREPLRYETALIGGERHIQVLALLFHSDGVRVAPLPRLPLAHPQLNLCAAVRDPEGVASLLFLRVMVPGWVLPAARLVAGQPVRSGSMSFARPSRDLGAESWRWEASRGQRLALSARLSAAVTEPPAGQGEGHRRLLDILRRRRRTYFEMAGGYRCLESAVPEVEAWPLSVEMETLELMDTWLPVRRNPAGPGDAADSNGRSSAEAVGAAGSRAGRAADSTAGRAASTPFPAPDAAVLLPRLQIISEYCLAPEALAAAVVPEPVTSRREPLVDASRSFVQPAPPQPPLRDLPQRRAAS